MGFITIFTMGMGERISVPLCSAGLWMDGLTAHFSLLMVMVMITVPLIMGMDMSILDIILIISLIASYVRVRHFPCGSGAPLDWGFRRFSGDFRQLVA
jgi:hypothetical protein